MIFDKHTHTCERTTVEIDETRCKIPRISLLTNHPFFTQVTLQRRKQNNNGTL